MSTVVLYCWCHSDSASFLLYFTLVRFRLRSSTRSAKYLMPMQLMFCMEPNFQSKHDIKKILYSFIDYVEQPGLFLHVVYWNYDDKNKNCVVFVKAGPLKPGV